MSEINETVLESLSNELISRSNSFVDLGVSLKLKIKSPNITVYFDPKTNKTSLNKKCNSNVVISMSADVAHQLFTGKVNIMEELASGTIEVAVDPDTHVAKVVDLLNFLSPSLEIYPKLIS